MRMVKQDCFALNIPDDVAKEKVSCRVIGNPKCEGCSFYKRKDEIKNNIFYKESYSSEEEYLKDVEDYKRKYNVSNIEEALK